MGVRVRVKGTSDTAQGYCRLRSEKSEKYRSAIKMLYFVCMFSSLEYENDWIFQFTVYMCIFQ